MCRAYSHMNNIVLLKIVVDTWFVGTSYTTRDADRGGASRHWAQCCRQLASNLVTNARRSLSTTTNVRQRNFLYRRASDACFLTHECTNFCVIPTYHNNIEGMLFICVYKTMIIIVFGTNGMLLERVA